MADEDESPPAEEAKERPSPPQPQHVIIDSPHGFFGRWIRRVFKAITLLLVLMLIAFVGITVLFQTSLARVIAADVATSTAGLDVTIGDLDIGWGGGITLSDLVVRLPGEAEEQGPLVLEVKTIFTKIPPLPLAALQGIVGAIPSPSLVEVDDVTVHMTEVDAGVWSVLRAIELASGAGGGGSSGSAPDAPKSAISLPPLPELRLSDAKVVFQNLNGDESRLEALSLHGRALSPLVYQFDVSTDDGPLAAVAKLTPHNGLTQEASLRVTPELAAAIAPFVGLPELDVDVAWSGKFTSDGGIDGMVTFDPTTQVAGIGAAGDVGFRLLPDGTILVEPPNVTDGDDRRLRLTNLPGLTKPAEVIAGVLRVTPEAVVVDRLLLDAVDGNVLIEEAVYDLANQTATASVAFQQIAPTADMVIDGTLQADLWYGRFGEPRARAAVDFGGTAQGRSFEDGSAAIDVTGYNYRDFRTLDIEVSVPDGVLTRDPEGVEFPVPPIQSLVRVRLDAGRDDVDDPHIELAQLQASGSAGSVKAQGIYYLPQPDHENEAKRPANYGVWVEAEGLQLTLPRMAEPLGLRLGVVAKGQIDDDGLHPVEITSLYGRYGDIDLFGDGLFLPTPTDDTPPLSMQLTLLRRELEAGDGEASNAAATGIAGDLTASLEVVGSIADLDLTAKGDLSAAKFAIGPYELGDASTSIDARVTTDQLDVLAAGSDFFGAKLSLDVDVPFNEDEPGLVKLDLDGLSVMRLGEVADIEVAGETPTGIIDVDFEARLNGFAPDTIRAAGEIVVRDLAIANAELTDRIVLSPVYLANKLTLPIEMSRTVPIGLRNNEELARLLQAQNDDDLDGFEPTRTLSLSLEYDLDRPDELIVAGIKADAFPVVPKPGALGEGVVGAGLVSLDSEALVVTFGGEESSLVVEGGLDLGFDFLTGPTALGLGTLLTTDVAITASDGKIELDTLRGELPGVATLTGGGTLQLADIAGQSRIWIDGDLKLDTLAQRLDLPEGGRGDLDFGLVVQPAPGERPRGEVLVDFSFSGRDARWRSVELDRGQFMAFLSRAPRLDGSPPQGAFDFTVMSTERIRILAAGGTLDGYAKFRDRRVLDSNGQLVGDRFIQSTLDGRGLDIAQIAGLAERDARGALDFGVELFGPIGSLSEEDAARMVGGDDASSSVIGRFNGGGFLRVRDGRLATLNFFRVILDATRFVKLSARDRLDARFRLESGDLFITSGVAFVDGIEIRGNLEIRQLFTNSTTQPISGAVIVLAKPLAAINLPFFAQAQEALDVLQANATALRLGGTLTNPTAVPALFSDFGSTLGALIGR